LASSDADEIRRGSNVAAFSFSIRDGNAAHRKFFDEYAAERLLFVDRYGRRDE
jgi:hypothetical protein